MQYALTLNFKSVLIKRMTRVCLAAFLEARDDAVTSLVDQFGIVRYDAAPSFLLVHMWLLVLCN